MDEDIKDIDKPFHVIGVLDGKENFHSGHDDLETAEARARESNDQAEKLKIKTRYHVRANKKDVAPV